MRGRLVAVATVLPLLLAACGTGGTAEDAPGQQTAATATTRAAKDVTEKDFDPGNFPAAAKVDNPWYPLVPARSTCWRGAPTGAKAASRTASSSPSPT